MSSNEKPQEPTPTPSVSTESPTPTPSAPRGSWFSANKKLVIIGSIIGAVFLITIIAAIVYVVAFSVSKKDYEELSDATRDVRTSYTSANLRFSSYYRSLLSGSSLSNSTKDSFEESYGEYKDNVAKLEGSKALRDSDIKESYDAFIEQNKKFTSFVDALIKESDSISAIGKDCSAARSSALYSSDLSDISKRYEDVIGDCRESLEKVKASEIPVLKEYAEKSASLYDDQKKIFSDMENAFNEKDRTKLLQARSELLKQSSKFSQLSTEYGKKLTDAGKDAETSDQLNDFIKTVNDKARS